MPSVHKPVLLHEVVEGLATPKSAPPSDGRRKIPWYLDGTIGGAGHAVALAEALQGKINVLGFDRDPEAVERARELLKKKTHQLILECRDFRNLDEALDKYRIRAVDLILLDLGVSSDELENSGRGFSFKKDEPLVMTFGDWNAYPFTALSIVNEWREADIGNVIFAYGEERYARRIAKGIVVYREKKPIETSKELGEIVKRSVPAAYRRQKTHPATKTFQALRIAVNDELAALRDGLAKGYGRLNLNGRFAVISFHSLEDRIVKDFFREKGREGARVVTKKPIRPSSREISDNPRSRSARLRILEKK